MSILYKIIYLIKYYIHNKKYFSNSGCKSKNIILVENYNYFPSTIAYSYFLNILADKYKSQIYSYDPLFKSFSRKLISYLNPKNFLVSLMFRSFNIKKKIQPQLNFKDKILAKKICNKIYKKIKKKKDILKIKISNTLIGDLIYDDFLRNYNKPTIDFKSKQFKNHLFLMICIYIFWSDYLNKFNVKSILISHSVYAIAIIARIAIKKNIKVYNVGLNYAYKLDKKKPLRLSGFDEYKKNFKKISKLNSKNLKLISKKELNSKIFGKKIQSFAINNQTRYSSFTNISVKKNKNLKPKILVAAHCFTDAVHAYGNNIFTDFFDWIEFLGNLSEKNNYEWLIKLHPSQYDLNIKKFEYFSKKYPKFKILRKDISHNEILNSYNILGVLTVYGSIGHEYPLFGVPVINASTNNPHANYNFNLNPKSKKQLENIIINIKNLKKIKSKKIFQEIYEFYYIRYMSDYRCAKNLNLAVTKLKNDYNSPLVYRWWLQNFSIKNHYKIIKDYKKFIKSGQFRMHADNTGNNSTYIDI
jgi:hypothetical protein